MRSTLSSIAEDISLFFLLILAVDALFTIPSGGVSTSSLMQFFYSLAFVQIGITLYVGGFDRLRTVSWLLLFFGWAAAEFASFARIVLPIGQTLFWVSVRMPWAEPILAWLLNNAALVPAMLLVIMLADTIIMHRRIWVGRSWWLFVVFIGAAAAVDLAMRVMLTRAQPAAKMDLALSLAVVPPWNFLPFYSILRSVPEKTVGVALFFAAVILPVAWPWMNVERLRAGKMQRVWLVAWLGFIAAFVGLAYLGAKPPEDGVIVVSRILVLWYFLFLLVVPPIIQRFSRSGRG